jgi:glycosyltransferase involved in cell wall biosynthesis
MTVKKDKPTICLVGPVAPFRGGIAQYTESLAGALEQIADLHVISFSRQYPKILYPGATDKDATKNAYENAEFLLDSNSPLSWRRTVKRITELKPDLVILNWWTLYWQPPSTYMARALRKKGIKVVYVCHSVFDHDAPAWKQRISKTMLRNIDGYILHSGEELGKVKEIKEDPVVVLRAMPIFGNFPEPTKKLPKRGKLEILFFGFIRPYKGLTVLMDAFEKLNDPDVYLTVVGEAWNNDGDAIKKLAAERKNVEAHIEYVDDMTAANYFQRADVVAVPYISATGSAAVATAYHYKKPVIATRVGSLKDAVVPKKTGWLVEPSDANAIAEVLSGIDRKECEKMAPSIESFNKENTWENLAKEIVKTYCK